MTSVEFCYWLQGYFELSGPLGKNDTLTHDQTECIRRHLALVFKHEIDGSYGDKRQQRVLQEIHDKKPQLPNFDPTVVYKC